MVSLITFVALVSFVVGLFATYIVRAVSRRIGFVDLPDGKRKIHVNPVALGGGVAVFATMCVIVGGGVMLVSPDRIGDPTKTIAVFVFSSILLLTGLIDDAAGMRGKYKLLAQLAANQPEVR